MKNEWSSNPSTRELFRYRTESAKVVSCLVKLKKFWYIICLATFHIGWYLTFGQRLSLALSQLCLDYETFAIISVHFLAVIFSAPVCEFISWKQIFLHQRYSNSDRQKRRRAHWPLDHQMPFDLNVAFQDNLEQVKKVDSFRKLYIIRL